MRLLLLGALLGSLPAQALEVVPYWQREKGYIALQQAARDAATDQQVLIVASHPDDRHVMPAAYLRFDRGWRVAILLVTRGEGGQNSKGPEIGDELGWRRTLETEACVALVDSEAWYLNREDAGFCRTAGEALELWGRDDTVRNMARIIRKTRPDVVLTTHAPDEKHGHDLALLDVLLDAVVMAEDPEVDLEGLAPVSVSKVFRGPEAAELDAVRDALPVEDHDCARGETYRRLAYAALKRHESQEPIRPIKDLFKHVVELYPMRDAEQASAWMLEDQLPSLFDDFEPGSEALALERSLDGLVDGIGSQATLVRDATRFYQQLQGLEVTGAAAEVRRQRRLEALSRVIQYGSGFRVTAEIPAGAVAVVGQSYALQLTVQNGGSSVFRDLRIRAGGGGQLELGEGRELLSTLPSGPPIRVAATFTPPPEARNRRKWRKALFSRDQFELPVSLECTTTVQVPGSEPFDLEFSVPVPLKIRPPAELEVSPRVLLLPSDKHVITLSCHVTRHTARELRGRLEVLGPPGFLVRESPVAVDLSQARYRDYQFTLRVPQSLRPGVYNVHVVLGDINVVVPLHKVDVAVPADLSVGLIRGVDDTVQSVLQAFVGERLRLLDEESLALQPLRDLDSIVVDIRALRERPGSSTWKAGRAAFPRLLEYVERGGRLVVLYHKDTEFNVDAAGYVGSPFPLLLGKNRVTREDAPVEILDSDHALLTTPNEVLSEDWDGWVQERGLYFPEDYAPEYEEILAMADPNHTKSRGALLYTRHGEGEYIYCALALYRQLDSLHPGACRIFANLVVPN